MSTHGYLPWNSEAELENAIERAYDHADSMLIDGVWSQEVYDQHTKIIDIWAKAQTIAPPGVRYGQITEE